MFFLFFRTIKCENWPPALQPFSVRVGAALPCVNAMAAFADVKEALLRFLSGVEGETPEGRKAKLENLCLLLATKPWNEQERQMCVCA